MKSISTNKAPKAIGPYSQAIVTNGTLYVSGQLPVDPKTEELVKDDIEVQTNMSLENLKQVILESGFEFEKVVKTTVYLDNFNDFSKMNKVYQSYFSEPYPARVCFEVAKLPKGALVEIEAIVTK